MRRYLTPDLVVLGDFAMREYTLTQAEDLYELVKGRYRHASLILQVTPARQYQIVRWVQGPVRCAGPNACRVATKQERAQSLSRTAARTARGRRPLRALTPTTLRVSVLLQAVGQSESFA